MTDHTSFVFSYGFETVIPVEIEVPSHRVTYYDPRMNRNLLLESLDLIDEKHEEADLRATAHRHRVSQHYDTKVQPRTFEIDDLILKRTFHASSYMNHTWKGPYVIEQRLGNGTSS